MAYRDFTADPQPRARWCGVRSRSRWSHSWRPFEGPLTPSAQHQAITILKILYRYLVDQNYLIGNPWSGVRVSKGSLYRLDTGRSLTLAQWDYIEGRLAELPETSANRRLRFALHLLYATGLRLSEAVSARAGDLTHVTYPGGPNQAVPIDGWLLHVCGKGGRTRQVPIPQNITEELADYLASRGYDKDLSAPTNRLAPLLAKSSDLMHRVPALAEHLRGASGDSLSASTLYGQIKNFFVECSSGRAGGGPEGLSRLASASTHWIRHTHASHVIADGMPVQVAQQNLGHASLSTTSVYVTTEMQIRLRAVEGFWQKRGPRTPLGQSYKDLNRSHF